MGTEAYEVMMATYPTMDGAAESVATLEEMAKAGSIEIIDAAVLTRDEDGSTSVEELNLPKPGSWAGKGAIIGAVVGVIFPPSLLAGAAIGAGLGAGSAALAKAALKSDDLADAAEDLEPGTSAFVAVVDAKWARQANEAMKGYNKLASQALDADAATHLGLIADDDTGTAAMTASAFERDAETGAVAAQSLQAVSDAESGVTVASGAAAVVDPDSGTVAAAAFEAVAVEGDEDSEDDAEDE